jgi:hypothetical protein
MLEYAEVEKAEKNAQRAQEATEKALKAYHQAKQKLDDKIKKENDEIQQFDKSKEKQQEKCQTDTNPGQSVVQQRLYPEASPAPLHRGDYNRYGAGHPHGYHWHYGL